MAEPLQQFSVTIPKRRAKLIVRVWPSLRQMHTYLKNHPDPVRGADACAGHCRSYVDRTKRRPQIVSEIDLARKYTSVTLVTHELSHAACFWAAIHDVQKGEIFNSAIGQATASEELFCWVLAEFSQAVTDGLRKAGVWEQA